MVSFDSAKIKRIKKKIKGNYEEKGEEKRGHGY